MNYINKIKETTHYLNERTHSFQPGYGIILGSGLGNLVSEIDIKYEIPYSEIPGFPVSTVKGHKGKLIFGYLSGQPIVAMAGRFHYYEGYSLKEVTFPVRVMKFLGIKVLFLSNAAGSLNENILVGDICIVRDHINLMPDHPLRGQNDEELGPRFPDMLKTYDQDLISKGVEIAKRNNIRIHTGVYVATPGPNLETPAEYKYMHIIGGDMVGMSTVPEVLVAKHMELPVFVMSVSTDMGYPPSLIRETTHDDVIKAAAGAEPKLTIIIKGMIQELG